MIDNVYIFQSPNNGRFCSGVFSSQENAEAFISKYSLSGVLTVYPVDESAYDWAIRMEHFKPKKEKELTPSVYSGLFICISDSLSL